MDKNKAGGKEQEQIKSTTAVHGSILDLEKQTPLHINNLARARGTGKTNLMIQSMFHAELLKNMTSQYASRLERTCRYSDYTQEV